MNKTSNTKTNNFISKTLMILGLSLLFLAILLVYGYSGLHLVFNWVDEGSPGPSHLLNHTRIIDFFNRIDYDYIFRATFIMIIVGVFLLSLFCMLIHNTFVKNYDKQNSTEIVIIHDDIIHVEMEKGSDGTPIYHPDKFIPKGGFYTMEDLYRRKGGFRIVLKIANYLALLAILSIIWVFYRGSEFAFESVFYPYYLGTDEAHIIIDFSLTFLLVYFLFRCPDFIKSLAATGFKRIYIRKSHLHETFIGLLLTFGGILLVMNGSGTWAYLDRATGLFLLLLGVFMIGRDWKDFVMGKFLRD